MRTFKVYISCPIALSDKTLSKYVDAAQALKVHVDYWKRNTYYCETANIHNCNAFVLILPKEDFKCSLSLLPPGCRLELKEAAHAKKDIFIGYTTSDGIAKFYETEIEGGRISGIVGTYTTLSEVIKKYEKKTFSSLIEFLNNNPVIGEKSSISPVIITVPRI